MSGLAKQRYLAILSSGVFATFSPDKLAALHQEVGGYLNVHSGQLDLSDQFDLYELQFYLALLTNHDVEAKSYLDRINDQFAGKQSQKIMILRLMYYEASGDMKAAVNALGDSADELRASRRLATFSRTKLDGSPNIPEYIKNLNYYLDLQPSDSLAWAELGDQYIKVGHYDKAAFCFNEVLLQEPNAYNIFYKVGLAVYYQFLQEYQEKNEKKDKLLAAMALLERSRNAFLRSVEISGSYVKSWVGVYVVSGHSLLQKLESNKTLAQLKKVAQFTSETNQLHQLSKKRIIELEELQNEDELMKYLEGAF